MEIVLDLDLIKDYPFDIEDFYVLEVQRSADKFLTAEEIASIAGVSIEKANEANRKIIEVMMLSHVIERSRARYIDQ